MNATPLISVGEEKEPALKPMLRISRKSEVKQEPWQKLNVNSAFSYLLVGNGGEYSFLLKN